jgi:hypothetical protein
MLAFLIALRRRQRFAAAVALLSAIAVLPWPGLRWTIGIARAASTEQAATCDKPGNLGADAKIRITEQMGRALVEVVKPNSAGKTLEIDYGDEVYLQKFGSGGSARVTFALTAPSNEFFLSMRDAQIVKCTLAVPEFAHIYRAILRWHDPVQLDLNVLEPGGRLNDTGNVSGQHPNTDLDNGIGRMDIGGGVPEPDATGEMSYVVQASAVPPDGVFGFKVDFVTRGSRAEPPYCDDNPLAAPRIDFIRIANGQVTVTKQTLARAHCHENIPNKVRLMLIRQ